MNKYRYRAHYKYFGPTAHDPLEKPKTEDELLWAIDNLESDLKHRVHAIDHGSIVRTVSRTNKDITVEVETALPRQQINNAMENCLKSFSMLGDIL